jgi:hypothetical protein
LTNTPFFAENWKNRRNCDHNIDPRVEFLKTNFRAYRKVGAYASFKKLASGVDVKFFKHFRRKNGGKNW